jgi:NADPH:quinone reductase-like Zn-dependent oxidoreductase
MSRAIQVSEYGAPPDVMRLEDVDPPVAGEGEVVLRVRAASANPVEWHMVRGEPLLVRLIAGLRRPKDPFVGGDAAGIVEAVGPGVDGFTVGDEVFGVAAGSFAELARADGARLARKPASLSFEQAAALPVAGCTALQALRDHGGLTPGQRVLIIGAAGGVGSLAVQIARADGAVVTGVCSTANLDFVRSLGAERVVDYTSEDVTAQAVRYDLVVQLAGSAPLKALRRLLAPGGTIVLAGTGTGRDGGSVLGPLARMARAKVRRERVRTFIAKIRPDDLATLASLVESGAVTPPITKTFQLADAAAALTQIESGHTRGKLVITIEPASGAAPPERRA